MSGSDPGPEDVAALADAMTEIVNCRDERARRDALETMPMAGVLFMAVTGTPCERWETDSPLVVVLSAIRNTLDGWAAAPSDSTRFAFVPIGDLDRLTHRMSAAIELARRAQMEATPRSSEPPPSEEGGPP